MPLFALHICVVLEECFCGRLSIRQLTSVSLLYPLWEWKWKMDPIEMESSHFNNLFIKVCPCRNIISNNLINENRFDFRRKACSQKKQKKHENKFCSKALIMQRRVTSAKIFIIQLTTSTLCTYTSLTKHITFTGSKWLDF